MLLICVTGSAAFAGNESTYTAGADNAAVLCSYNQHDTFYWIPYSATLIPPGESARIGCSDAKPIFAKRPTQCRIRGMPSVTEQQIVTLVALKNVATALGGVTSSAGAIWTAIKTAVSFESDIAKNICKNLMGISIMPYLGMVPRYSSVELNDSGMSVQLYRRLN